MRGRTYCQPTRCSSYTGVVIHRFLHRSSTGHRPRIAANPLKLTHHPQLWTRVPVSLGALRVGVSTGPRRLLWRVKAGEKVRDAAVRPRHRVIENISQGNPASSVSSREEASPARAGHSESCCSSEQFRAIPRA